MTTQSFYTSQIEALQCHFYPWYNSQELAEAIFYGDRARAYQEIASNAPEVQHDKLYEMTDELFSKQD